MKNRIVCLILIAIIASIFIGLAIIKKPSKPSQKGDQILVTTSFYPLAEFAQKIGQDKVQVINLTPAGTEPHDFEPTPQDLVKIYNSKVFIYNGAGLEPWVDKIIPDLISRNVVVVKATENINLLGSPTKLDPHVWLDPVFAQTMAINIKTGLQKADPANANYYGSNSDALVVKLVNLDQNYINAFYNCKQKDVVSSHEVLGYLSKRYKFQAFSISGLSPDEEPSSQKLADLSNLVKEVKVKYILTETLVSPKLADTLANETGVTTLVFNPIEGLTQNEINAGQDYFSIQQNNIKNLSTALECQTP